MRCLIGVDIGTQGSKGVLLAESGQILATASTEHALSVPRPSWAEHDAEEVWWGGFVRTVQALLYRAQIDPRAIAAVSISAISPAMLPIDAAGRPLRPAILYSDTRAHVELAEMNDRLGVDGRQRLTAQDIGPKLAWYRHHEPDRWRRTHRILNAHGYVIAKLTGRQTIDLGAAFALRPLFDQQRRVWDAASCDLFEVPIGCLPEVVEATEIVGVVTPAAAGETGLAAGTPVTGGITDFSAEALSTGAGAAGEVIVSYGTTLCLAAFSRRPIPGQEGLWEGPHLFSDLPRLYPGIYAVGGGMSTSAALTRWFRDHFGQRERGLERDLGVSAYSVLGLEAEAAVPGADGLVVLPYFSGERSPINDDLARGVIFGLTLAHGRGHIYRALLEGVAYGLQHNLEVVRQAGVPLCRIVATGGGSRSHLWTQIVSDITGLPQEVMTPSNAAFGSAFLAGYAAGIFEQVGDVRRWVRSGREVQPRREVHELYQAYYAIYRRLYESTKEEMHALARLTAEPPSVSAAPALSQAIR